MIFFSNRIKHDLMIVSFPWYDFSETGEAWDRLWLGLRQSLLLGFGSELVSPILDRKTPHFESLLSPELLITQTCGFDIAWSTPKALKIILTPIFSTEGAQDGFHSSFLVSRQASPLKDVAVALEEGRFVANDPRSFSGFQCVGELGPVKPLWSGSHLQSLSLIKSKQADWAAIDAVTWGLLKKYRPSALSGLQIFAQTRKVPAPPFVTASDCSHQNLIKLRQAFLAFSEKSEALSTLEPLMISGFRSFTENQYRDAIISPILAKQNFIQDLASALMA